MALQVAALAPLSGNYRPRLSGSVYSPHPVHASMEIVAMMKWRAVKTAPKDGNVFLAYWGKCITLAMWNEQVSNWQEAFDGDFDNGDELTHWMPLPEAPDA